MENLLVADEVVVQESPATTKPTPAVQSSAIMNLIKTGLFLAGIGAMIINQSRKDKAVTNFPEVSSDNTPVMESQAVIHPFTFFK